MKEYGYPFKLSPDINIMDRALESQLGCNTFLFIYFYKIKQHRMMSTDNGGTNNKEEIS